MRKLIMILAAVTVLFSSVAFADDLPAMTDEALLALHQDVLDEMARRGLAPEPGEISDVPARQEEPSLPASFRDAADAAGEYIVIGCDVDYLVLVWEKDGRYFRTVTILDDRAKELYMAFLAADDAGAANDAFDAYAWSLPVCYVEEITSQPKTQEELDAETGKTVGELVEEGYSFCGHGGGENLPTSVDLSFGLFLYEFEIDFPFEEYLEHNDWEDLKDRKVKKGKLSFSFSPAVNLDYLADGTYQPLVVPNITAEEASAADSVPPLEEYSRNTWPLNAEGYSDLRRNMDARYGQVYLVEGVVHQVLSQNPLKVIIQTGEDGQSQPVIVEFPESLSISLEADTRYRIYADVSFVSSVIPVLKARYLLIPLSESPAD